MIDLDLGRSEVPEGIARRLRHYRSRPITFDRQRRYSTDGKLGHKPEGLWVSVGDEWREWCVDNDFYPEWTTVEHVVTLAADARILTLTTEAMLRDFDTMYSRKQTSFPTYGMPNWSEVAKDFDGIIIAPRMNPYAGHIPLWYSTWDVASGCIWNLSAIRSIVAEGHLADGHIQGQEEA